MSELVFVTGGSGFLGSHIVNQLLHKGYRVRAAARGAKVAQLTSSYSKFGVRFEVVVIADVSTDQFPDALKGADAVIHAAAPIAGRAEHAAILKGAIEGTLNVVRQAQKAGITRIVVTSSIVTMLNPGNSFTDKDWYSIPEGPALSASRWETYCAAKTLAEQALWAYNDQHPELDITTLNPPYLYGPFAEGFTLPTPDYHALSTNLAIYRFLKPSSTFPPGPAHADVRDVAMAHVRALTSPPTSSVGRKRILFSSPHGLDFARVVKLIAEKRPALRERLIRDKPPTFGFDRLPIDFGRIEEVLGMQKEDFESVEGTILGAVDGVFEIEKQWVDQGYVIAIPDA